MKGVGEGMGSFPPPRPNIGFQIGEPLRKANAIDKKPIAIHPDASFLVNESTVKDTSNVSTSLKFFLNPLLLPSPITVSNHDVLHVFTNSVLVFPLHLQVDSPIIKTPKGKHVKESSNSMGQLRKVKILNENLKVQSNQYNT